MTICNYCGKEIESEHSKTHQDISCLANAGSLESQKIINEQGREAWITLQRPQQEKKEEIYQDSKDNIEIQKIELENKKIESEERVELKKWESKAKEAESKAKEAESKAKEAESKTREAETKLARLQQQKDEERKPVVVDELKDAKDFGTHVSKTIPLTAENNFKAEMMIKAGFADNINDLTNKLLKLQSLEIGGKSNEVLREMRDELENKKKVLDVNELMNQMMAQKMIEKMQSSDDKHNTVQQNNDLNINEIMKFQVLKETLKTKENSGDADTRMMMMEMQKMQQQFTNQLIEMQRRMDDRMAEERKQKEIDELKKMVIESQNKKNNNFEDFEKLLRLTQEKSLETEKMKVQLQQEKDRRLLILMRSLKDKISEQRNQKGWNDELARRIQDKATEALVKKIEEGLNSAESKDSEGTGRLIYDIINSTAEKLSPALQAWAERPPASQPQHYETTEQLFNKQLQQQKKNIKPAFVDEEEFVDPMLQHSQEIIKAEKVHSDNDLINSVWDSPKQSGGDYQ